MTTGNQKMWNGSHPNSALNRAIRAEGRKARQRVWENRRRHAQDEAALERWAKGGYSAA